MVPSMTQCAAPAHVLGSLKNIKQKTKKQPCLGRGKQKDKFPNEIPYKCHTSQKAVPLSFAAREGAGSLEPGGFCGLTLEGTVWPLSSLICVVLDKRCKSFLAVWFCPVPPPFPLSVHTLGATWLGTHNHFPPGKQVSHCRLLARIWLSAPREGTRTEGVLKPAVPLGGVIGTSCQGHRGKASSGL